jgi:hypothetical protein
MKKFFFCFPYAKSAIKLQLRRMPTLWSVSRHLSSVTLVRSVILFSTLYVSCFAYAQLNTDNAYRRPLKNVLEDIEKRYGIKINYVDSMVVNKTVSYADWRYRNDVEETLDNVLTPLDMKVKKEKDKVYKLSYYEYYRWSVEEGWAELDRIASQYKNLAEWEKRKKELKICLLEALQLSKLPDVPNSKPIITRQ